MLVASALFMAAVHDFENVVTDVSDVSCNIVQLRYAVFFLGRRPLLRSHDEISHMFIDLHDIHKSHRKILARDGYIEKHLQMPININKVIDHNNLYTYALFIISTLFNIKI